VKLMTKAPKPEHGNEAQPTGDPYIDARGAWMERYGTYVQQAYNWRLVAMLEAIALVAAVVGIIYLASQTKFVPYVVAIDKVGSAIAVAPADRAAPVDPRVVRAQLANFIVDARTVGSDRIVTLATVTNAYNYVASDSPAFGYMNEWYSAAAHDPLKRGVVGSDQVAVNAILPISPSSYELQWTETLRDQHGKITGTELWDATVSLTFRQPTTEAEIIQNPLGLRITSLSWTKKIN
jgi:type IV secretory pathway TrbF-like protein